ncbi:TPT-domain-containing protein [Armillaria luteobubalina]|uniref:TPT-domain-containing protein n=1 Tax=Armillaria luteobubalina TaxID=153913 RepID=A0AA39QA50_9AGAR|nr:TPT-domain-containing protein [Armillaria luteobubalina]
MYHREPFPQPPSMVDLSDVSAELPPPRASVSSFADRPSYLSTQAFWLALYFCFNLSLTLYNKGVLLRFPYPYTLTAIHALFGTFGGSLLLHNGSFLPAKLDLQETIVIVAFSVLYSVNIVVSNLSLQLVTIPFHQVIRAATPIFTILFSALLYGRKSSYAKRVSLVPVVIGVGFATYGDYYCTLWGFILTLLGTLLASLKTIFTNVLQTPPSRDPIPSQNPLSIIHTIRRPHLHSLALLHVLSPLAFIQCVFLAYFTGELANVQHYASKEMTFSKACALALNGCIALGLNIVSFTANRKVGALGMTVAANVKQVLTVLSAVLMFDLTISAANGIGIALTLIGGAWYAQVEFMERKRRTTGQRKM